MTDKKLEIENTEKNRAGTGHESHKEYKLRAMHDVELCRKHHTVKYYCTIMLVVAICCIYVLVFS
jgi:hypothetical protein